MAATASPTVRANVLGWCRPLVAWMGRISIVSPGPSAPKRAARNPRVVIVAGIRPPETAAPGHAPAPRRAVVVLVEIGVVVVQRLLRHPDADQLVLAVILGE